MSTERWSEVEALFSALNELLNVLEQERRALLSFDVEALESWTAARAQCLNQVTRCAKPWGPEGCPWPEALGATTVADALKRFKEEDEPMATSWRLELRQRRDQISAAQSELAELSCRALHWVNQCLGEEDALTYDGYGARVVPLHNTMMRRLVRRV